MSDRTTSPADVEKSAPYTTTEEGVVAPRPSSWKYKDIKIGPWRLPWYASPPAQLIIVAFVCFLCPGMFNALSGLGGGGQIDQGPANDANTALYSTFAVVGFFSGSIANKLGVRITLGIGGLGYSIYVASFLSYSHNRNYGFTVFAGAFLGICAGLLWTAQGAIMMAYPPEQDKGRYISWFWIIFNLGGVLGGLIPLGQNIHSETKKTVTDGTYIGFLILTLIGAGLALTLVNAKDVIRKDGSRVIMMKNPTWASELKGLVDVFITDPYIVMLFPMFFASNFFYGYQFNAINGRRFNTRTSSLNNVLYWTAQMVGASIFGYALDLKQFRRTTRARVSWIVILSFTMAVWGGGYAFQKTYTREQFDPLKVAKPPVYDWKSNGYIGAMFLYIFYGVYDAAFQTCVYWYMGALTNNSRKLANFAGFYKGIQSAGSAIMWALDKNGVAYIRMLGACWGLLVFALLFAFPVIWGKIRDHVPVEDDLAFTDETLADVNPTLAVDNVKGEKVVA